MTESTVYSPERFGPAPLLRDVLIESAFSPNRSLPESVDRIDLGVFSEEVEKMAMESFLSPEKKFLTKVVYVNGRGSVLVQKRTFESQNGQAQIVGQSSSMPRAMAKETRSKERYPGMFITVESKRNSAIDLGSFVYLLADNSFEISLTSSMLETKDLRHIFFRGKDSPQMSIEKALEKFSLWDNQILERIGQHTSPEMTEEERLSIAERAGWALVRQICRTYDLNLFSGSSHAKVLERQAL